MYTGELYPFSIEAAIKGGKVVTRKGHSVILTTCQITSPYGGIVGYPLHGLLCYEGRNEPMLLCWTYDGEYINGGVTHDFDLFMAED